MVNNINRDKQLNELRIYHTYTIYRHTMLQILLFVACLLTGAVLRLCPLKIQKKKE